MEITENGRGLGSVSKRDRPFRFSRNTEPSLSFSGYNIMIDPSECEKAETFRSQTDLDSLRLINLARKLAPDQSGFEDAVLPLEAKTASLIEGNLFGDYIRVRLIGKGGMGEVWKAWDTVLHRWVALKFPTSDFILELDQLKEEARNLAALSHPNIAPVYDFSVHNGKPVLAMQYVEGAHISDIPSNDPTNILHLVREAALGIAYAHSHGIVHRDIKPQNILVDLERNRTYVLDFGLACQEEGQDEEGSRAGTPLYMAPEQVKGEAVDRTTDVYALGTMTAQLLSPTYLEPNSSRDQIFYRIVHESFHPLPSIDQDLNAILAKCLEKDPADRYRTAGEFAEDLTRYLEGDPVLAQQHKFFYRIRKKASKNWKLLAVAAAGLIGVIAIAGLIIPSWKKEESLRIKGEAKLHHEQKKSEKQLDLEREKGEAKVVNERIMAEERQKKLNTLNALWIDVVLARKNYASPARNAARIREKLQNTVDAISPFIEKNPTLVQGYYIRAMGRIYLGELEQAEKDLRRAVSIDDSFRPGNSLLGRVLLERYLLAEQHKRNRGRTPYNQEGRIREAKDYLLRAARGEDKNESISKWGIKIGEEEIVTSVLSEALTEYYAKGNVQKAESLLQQADKKIPSEMYSFLSGFWSREPEKAIRHYTEAIRRMHHFTKAYFNRGNLLEKKGDLDGAINDFTRTIEIQPTHAPAIFTRGRLYARKRQWENAIADFSRTLDFRKYPTIYLSRARAYVAMGEESHAIRDMESALAQYSSEHPHRSRVQQKLSILRGRR